MSTVPLSCPECGANPSAEPVILPVSVAPDRAVFALFAHRHWARAATTTASHYCALCGARFGERPANRRCLGDAEGPCPECEGYGYVLCDNTIQANDACEVFAQQDLRDDDAAAVAFVADLSNGEPYAQKLAVLMLEAHAEPITAAVAFGKLEGQSP